ncbi:LytTR family DNA-binding domain-containing protein [uncultured Croceitalea sp.]|uniref:LytR/AlgR family response regulator transcription factor n=1 Tax=uncultured Croceitalea sp. TaxID=1798908 RepID=UPI0033057571
MRKTYFTVTILLFTIVGTILLDLFKWIPVDASIYYVQLAIFTLTSLSVILLIVFILPEVLPVFFKTAWKTKSFFLLPALACGLALTKFGVYALQYELSFFNPLLIRFLGIEVFIVLASLLVFRARSADTMVNADMEDSQELEKPKEQLTIKGELLNENFTLTAERLLYIKSSDNYSEFYFNTSEGMQHKLMRLTLKSVEEQIPYDYMVRSHNSYIVNMTQIKSITGNVNNSKLHFKNQDLSLPVSRSRRDKVIRVLKALVD